MESSVQVVLGDDIKAAYSNDSQALESLANDLAPALRRLSLSFIGRNVRGAEKLRMEITTPKE